MCLSTMIAGLPLRVSWARDGLPPRLVVLLVFQADNHCEKSHQNRAQAFSSSLLPRSVSCHDQAALSRRGKSPGARVLFASPVSKALSNGFQRRRRRSPSKSMLLLRASSSSKADSLSPCSRSIFQIRLASSGSCVRGHFSWLLLCLVEIHSPHSKSDDGLRGLSRPIRLGLEELLVGMSVGRYSSVASWRSSFRLATGAAGSLVAAGAWRQSASHRRSRGELLVAVWCWRCSSCSR